MNRRFFRDTEKGSCRFRNLGSDRQLTAGKFNYLGGGSVHGRAGRYRLAAIKITGKDSGSGWPAAAFFLEKTLGKNPEQLINFMTFLLLVSIIIDYDTIRNKTETPYASYKPI